MRVGFAGLGAIGLPMAERCAAAHELTVWNRTGERAMRFAAEHPGVKVASNPHDLAAGADAVITCLPTSADVEALLAGDEGLLGGFPPHGLLIDCTSGDPATSRRIAMIVGDRGVAFVDAPVSGGPPLAREGRLTVMCGGSEADVRRAEPFVAPFAARVERMGPVGTGHAMKAVNNALLATNILALAEGLVTLAKAGLKPRAILDVLNASSGRSFVSETLIPERVLTGEFPRLFRLALLEKDIGIAHALAQELGVSDPVMQQARERYRVLRGELGEDADYLDPIRSAEQAAGVELRGVMAGPVLVLVAVQDLVNLASCIRIAKNFGLDTVRLVAPECPVDFYRIEGVAHNTADLLERMTTHATLDDALADITHVHALTGRERTAKRTVLRAREGAEDLIVRAASGRVAVLAGREDKGLSNEEIDRCDALVTISANPQYNSLNLAQAVAVYAYELWVARGGDALPLKPPRKTAEPTTHAQMEALYATWEGLLHEIDFFKARQPGLVMRSFREIVYRADVDAREAALLRAIGLEVGHHLRRVQAGTSPAP